MSITTAVKFMCATKYTSSWHEKHHTFFFAHLKWSMASIGFNITAYVYFMFLFSNSESFRLFFSAIWSAQLPTINEMQLVCFLFFFFFTGAKCEKNAKTNFDLFHGLFQMYIFSWITHIYIYIVSESKSNDLTMKMFWNEQVNIETMRSIGKVRELNQVLRR